MSLMTDLSSRHVDATEAARLHVKAGWYGVKISGTFVTGPHETEKECDTQVKALMPAPVRPVKHAAV